MDTYRSQRQAHTLSQQLGSQSVALPSVNFKHPSNGVMIVNGSTSGSGGGSGNMRINMVLMGITGATFTFRGDIHAGLVGVYPFLTFGVHTTGSTSVIAYPTHIGLY